MKREIAQLGQPILRCVAETVGADELDDPEFRSLLADMYETLEVSGGVGLAAPQVFAGKRLFLARILPPPKEDENPGIEVFVNPRLTALTHEVAAAWEGCLSFAELLVLVPRARAVRVDYFDALGQPRTITLEGFPARVVQHEFDHLEGILTIDRAASTLDIIKASEIETVLGEDENDPEGNEPEGNEPEA